MTKIPGWVDFYMQSQGDGKPSKKDSSKDKKVKDRKKKKKKRRSY